MNELCSLIEKKEAPKKKINALEKPKPVQKVSKENTKYI